ncbi:MAG: hypothetical protein IKN41_00635 [Candidatus Methanomethylophilaceae archaeon]|nr:hypothetical protein [Candidatus Methanomethylophilaceae archaeon]MBR6910347.1 hypothetical protein [Candidatus Methanomethylophilaceae archaeon]
MDTRKTTLIATIAVIALLAVGIGFAYTAYTENSNNTSNVAYLKLTQTGPTGYTFSNGTTPIQFDTFNEIDTGTVYYGLKESVSVTGGLTNAYTCAKLGSITLQSAFTSTGGTTPPATVNIDAVSSEKFNSDGTWVFFITDTAHTKIYAYKNTAQTEPGWTDGPDALTIAYDGNVTVDILYGFDSTTTPAKEFDGKKFYTFSLDMAQPLLNGASLIFSAEDKAGTSTTLDTNALKAKTVTLKAGEGTGEDIVIKYNGSYKLPNCTFTAPANKVFSKWKIGDDQYAAETVVSITADTTITAIWATPTP